VPRVQCQSVIRDSLTCVASTSRDHAHTVHLPLMTQHTPATGPQDRRGDDQQDAAPPHEVAVALAAAQLGVSIWMGCAEDGREHAVTDPAFVAGHQDSQGTYRALCHHLVTLTASAPTPRVRCESCKSWLLDRARNEPEPHWMRWVHALINLVACRTVVYDEASLAFDCAFGNFKLFNQTDAFPVLPSARQWEPAHMADEIMWMRCLDKRDHVILDEAVILRAGLLKAACKRRVYLLSVSAKCPRRCCRACLKVVGAVSDSLSQRIPEQRTRLGVVGEVPESLTVTSPAFLSSSRGRPSVSGIPAESVPQRAGRGSTFSSTVQNNRPGPPASCRSSPGDMLGTPR
jgi:hypothetical protein